MEAGLGITRGEHRERQSRVRAAAADRGLRAVVAFSRGGGTHDRVADALWLSGLATTQPFVPDLPGHWRAAGHVAVVVPVAGETTAIIDAEQLQTDPVADRVVVSDDVIAASADALAAELSAREAGRVGVFGSDAVPAVWWRALSELVAARRPGAAIEPADDLSLGLRRIKSPGEPRLLRAAGSLGAQAMGAALDAARPGSTEAAVAAALIERVVREGGAIYGVAISSGSASRTLGPSGGGAGAAVGRPVSSRPETCCASMPTGRLGATCSTSLARRWSAAARPVSRRN